MRRLAPAALTFALALPLACSPERPAPEPETATQTAPPAPTPTATTLPELQKGTYDEALLWMRSTRRLRFVVDEGGVHAEGEMTRTTPGAEKVRFRANGEQWEAAATPQGVAWKREGKAAEPPAYRARLCA